MNQALKRIEEALNQLETQKNAANPQPDTTKRSYSFDIFLSPKSDCPQPQVSDSSRQTPKAAKAPELPYLNPASNSCLPAEETIEVSSLPEIIEDTDERRRVGGSGGAKEQKENLSFCAFATLDTLPPVGNSPTWVSSSLPDKNLKSKSQNSPTLSHDETIEQIVHQIQDLYHSGPIVDGYLEYYPPAPQGDPMLREVCFERVIDRLEEVSNLTSGQEIDLPGASYLLCGVDASGQQWSYPCPLDQLPSVSMAIARYQKLQQLLQQKHELEQNRVNKDE